MSECQMEHPDGPVLAQWLVVFEDDAHRRLCDQHRVLTQQRFATLQKVERLPEPGITCDGALQRDHDLAVLARLRAPAERPEWDEYFFGIAEAVAVRADCTRRQVGAVLVGPDHRVLSTGYNGAPSGVPGCASAGACPRGRQSLEQVPSRTSYATGEGACIALHAEVNAIMYSRPSQRAGSTMYVTCEPCPQCYAMLEACGITDVRWPAGTD